MKIFIFFLLSLINILITSNIISAQTEVSFSIIENQEIGCAPFTITLINTSENIENTTFTWDMGEGGQSNNKDVVDAVFNTPGQHTITLSAFNSSGGVINTYSKDITVYQPFVSFEADRTRVCVGENINFTSTVSGLPEGVSVENYIWNFGDGSPIPNSPNPAHSYFFGDVFDVFLQIKDNNNCYSEISLKEKYLTVIDDFPNTDNITFSPEFPIVCANTIDVSIINNTKENYEYHWDFGDGTSSTQPTPPTHIYQGYGTYTLNGTVTNSIGCSAPTPPLQIMLLQFDYSDFDMFDIVKQLQDGDTACRGKIAFENKTINDIRNLWHINGEQVSNTRNLEYDFTNPGNYEITLISSNGYCEKETTKTIVVEAPINREIFIENPFGCTIPHTVTYRANEDIESFSLEWILNNNLYNTSEISITYDESLALQDTLIVTTPNQCVEIIPLPTVEVFEIDAILSADKTNGCIPLEVNFAELFNYYPSENQDRVISWIWSPIEGISDTTTSNEYTYTYTQDGVFTASVIVETENGCTDTAYIEITPGDVPIIDYKIVNDTICAGESVAIEDLSSDADKIDFRMASFVSQNNRRGGGSDVALRNDFILEPILDGDIGCFDLIYQVKYHECEADPRIVFEECAVYVKGPVAWVRTEFDCDTPYERKFILDSIYDAESWNWTMGDDTEFINTNDSIISHTYSETGDFDVKFEASKDDCIYTKRFTERIRDINMVFTTPTPVCKNSYATFNYDNSTDVENLWWFATSPSGNYNIQELSPDEASSSLFYAQKGNYEVGLLGADVNGCIDSSQTIVTVKAPIVSFTKNKSQICKDGDILFNSTSTSNGVSIVSTLWEINSDTVAFSGEHITNNFSKIGYNYIKLIIEDSEGCSDFAQDSIQVITTFADFKVLTPKVCIGHEASFEITEIQNADYYTWIFGDGESTTNNFSTITYLYNTSPSDSVTLISNRTTIHDDVCTSSVSHPISVKDLSAKILLPRDSLGCYKFDYIFTPKMANFVPDYEWYAAPYGVFGENIYSPYAEPFVQFPGMAGYHKIALVTRSDYKGCELTSDTVNVYIDGAKADFTISRDLVCVGDEIVFQLTADTMNIYNSNFAWYFGDGNISKDIVATHSYSFIPQGEYFTSLFKIPTCIDIPKKNIKVQKVMADFWLGDFDADSVACTPFTVDLKNTSVGADSYLWTFPDGTTSSDINTSFTFTKPGQINEVELFVENNLIDCPNTKIKLVRTLPKSETNIESLYRICEGDSLLVAPWGNYGSFEWLTPYDGLSTPNNDTTWANIDSSKVYKYKTISEDNCEWIDSVKLYYQKMPEYTGAPYNPLLYKFDDDTLEIDPKGNAFLQLVYNETYSLNNTEIEGIVYQWIPSTGLSCDNCANPNILLFDDQEYTIQMFDTAECSFDYKYKLSVKILKESKADVPSAFSPNGDGDNDLLKVRGWGLDYLVYFRIYNRWGQLVYESDKLDHGWDGTYKGVSQPIGTFAYMFEVVDYNGEHIIGKGYVDLLR
jgi:gliding motility-associated-like protein